MSTSVLAKPEVWDTAYDRLAVKMAAETERASKPLEAPRLTLMEFIREAWHLLEPAPFVDNWHIACIADHLEAVTRGELRDLVINIPPRSSKSLLASVFWPAWEWTWRPEERYLTMSYAQALSMRDAMKMRRLVQSRWYREKWGHVFHLTSDQNAKGRFENNKTGYRIASSVGGLGTGEGGSRVCVDDPHNVVQGESDAMRQAVLDWWDGSMSTRGNDPTSWARVIIMQRVHALDLTGHVMQKGTYHHLVLPARYEPPTYVPGSTTRDPAIPQPHDDCTIHPDPRSEPGELLNPVRFPDTELRKIEADLGPIGAAGQLQQRPVPREGAVFKAEWFRSLPAGFNEPGEDGKTFRSKLQLAQFWDLAWSEKTWADHTACCTLGVDDSGNTYILHVWRGRVDESGLEETMRTVIGITKPHTIGIEIGAFQQKATRDLIRRLNAKLVGTHAASAIGVEVTRDKVFRAQLPAGRLQAGLVYADTTAPWWPKFLQEALAFGPTSSEDDQVDALSGAMALIAKMRPGMSVQQYGMTDGNQKRDQDAKSWLPFEEHVEAQEKGREKEIMEKLRNPYGPVSPATLKELARRGKLS